MRLATLAQDVREIRLAADDRTLIYRSHDRLRAIDAHKRSSRRRRRTETAAEAGRKSGWIDLDRISVEVIPRDEWAQMYREAWRLQREQFWVADMSDVDWDRVFERYNRFLPRVRTRIELSDFIWEMQGELGTSHAYEYGGDVRVPPQYSQGFLGADSAWDEREGGYRIERIYRGDSWNRDIDSPLAEPGLDVHEGDVIIAIGGKRLTHDVLARRSAGQHGRTRSFAHGRARKERGTHACWSKRSRANAACATALGSKPTAASCTNKPTAKSATSTFPTWDRGDSRSFIADFLTEFDRRGLIVDVRYNRGGHVSPLLLGKLARKRVGYDIPRYGPPQPVPAGIRRRRRSSR